MVDHLRSAIKGLSFIGKFRLDRINSFGVRPYRYFYIVTFWLKIAYLLGYFRYACAQSRVNLLPR